jgi:hypothetical protein
VNLTIAMVKGEDVGATLKELAALPLEKLRVAHRIGLEVGVCGFRQHERRSGSSDTLPERSFATVGPATAPAPSVLSVPWRVDRAEEMEALMISALKNARVVAEHSDR